MYILKNGRLYKKCVPLLLILFLFIFIRLLLLFGSTKLFYDKELYIGTVAYELINHTDIPLIEFQKGHHSGGRLFMGLFTVPFFILFGIKGASLKLASLAFSSIILIAYYIFIRKYFDTQTAVLWSLFFIFSCPTYTRFTLINTGTHLEFSLFIVLTFFLLYRILINNNQNSSGCFFGIGLSLGIGIWFIYTHLITLFICLTYFYLLRNKIKIRHLLWFVIGLSFGLSPWLYYNLTHDFMGFFMKGSKRYPYFVPILNWINFKAIFPHTQKVFFYYLPGFYNFTNSRYFKYAQALSSFNYFIFILSLLYLAYYDRQGIMNLSRAFLSNGTTSQKLIRKTKPITPILLFIILFILALLFSDFADNIDPRRGFLGYRYLLPLYTLQLLTISIFLKRVRKALLKISIAIVLIGSGVFGIINDVSLKNIAEKNFKFYRPYSYEIMGFRFAEAFWSFNKRYTIYLMNKIPEQYRGYAYEGLGWEATSKLNSGETKDLDILSMIEPEYQKRFIVGIGRYSYHEAGFNKEKLDYFISKIPQDLLPYFYYGLGQRKFMTFQDNITEWLNYPLIMKTADRYLPFYYKGIGFAIGSSFGFSKEQYNKLIAQIPEKYKGYANTGLQNSLQTITNLSY